MTNKLELISYMVSQGYTMAVMANVLKVHPSTVCRFIAKHQIREKIQ